MGAGAANAADSEWTTSAGDDRSHRHAGLTQVTKDNLENLEQAWVFRSGSIAPKETVQATPIFARGKLVTVTLHGDLIALDPVSGKRLWTTHLKPPLGRRGLTFAGRDGGAVFVASGDEVVEAQISDGKIVRHFSTGTTLLAPIIDGDVLLAASLNDGVQAFDIVSGKQMWRRTLEMNNLTPRIWSGFSYDHETATAYVVTSNPRGLVGSERNAADLSSSLIAIDATDGSIKWSYQHIAHDLWDFDVVANPILLTVNGENGGAVKAVAALSKTGDTIFLRADTGAPVFANSITDAPAPASDVPNEITARVQKVYALPEPYSGTVLDIGQAFRHLDQENAEFVLQKIRHAKAGFFVPPSLNYDVVLYGVHGGAEWTGGSIYPQADGDSLILAYNRDPWILRLFYVDKRLGGVASLINRADDLLTPAKNFFGAARNAAARAVGRNSAGPDARERIHAKNADRSAGPPANDASPAIPKEMAALTRWNNSYWAGYGKKGRLANAIYPLLPGSAKNALYTKKCASCHGNARQGTYQSENYGDGFRPPLVGISLTDKWRSVDTAAKLGAVHSVFGVTAEISEKDYARMMAYFAKHDARLARQNKLGIDSFWQTLLDKRGLPATTPPWGGVVSIDMTTGRKQWDVAIGRRDDPGGGAPIIGDQNFGGVLTTDSGIVFLSGNPDEMAYALDASSGVVLWSDKLPFAGSAPPMSFEYHGCQMVVFTATGGRFFGYRKNGDALVAYKLRECSFD
jgi:glucose dehydrogenase